MPTIETGGAELQYESTGSGEPLLLIPGFASGIWSWLGQAGLSEQFRLIRFDPKGIGKSPPANGQSMETFTADLLGLMNELEIERANILGVSFGGFVAMEFASRFPHRVDKLILGCTSAGGTGHVSPSIEILQSFTRNPELTVGDQIRKFFRPAFTEVFHAEHADVVEKVCRLREENEVNEETYVAQLRTAFSFDVSGQLDQIDCETLVVTGDQDNLVPMQNSEILAAKLPNATLEVIHGGSHMIFVENAAEFNRIVTDFLMK